MQLRDGTGLELFGFSGMRVAVTLYSRFEGKQVLYMTGTDEHGQKIQRSAAAKGIPTQQFCDEVGICFSGETQILQKPLLTPRRCR
jgi:hypothetical protein